MEDTTDPELLIRTAPWLTPERARHWTRMIAKDVSAGRYTAARGWEIATAILAEREA
jgi:hypothetical protein